MALSHAQLDVASADEGALRRWLTDFHRSLLFGDPGRYGKLGFPCVADRGGAGQGRLRCPLPSDGKWR